MMNAHGHEYGSPEACQDFKREHLAEYRRYKVQRVFYSGRRPRLITKGLTLAEAQAHCSDPETSSSTAMSAKARAYTRQNGAWFDSYEAQ